MVEANATYAGIICRNCGKQDITYHNYMMQMNRPNSFWRCPKCGDDCQFDDDRYEEINFKDYEDESTDSSGKQTP